jgi:Ca2+-binding RTX toxin-like protein
VLQYDLNGNLESGVASASAATGTNASYSANNPGTTFSLDANNVVDTTGQATATQVATLYKSSSVNGTFGNDNLVGTAGDDFITGQGGNDTLTGGAGRDVFAWLKSDTGSDTVTDFKVSEGDQVNLAGMLHGLSLSKDSSAALLGMYLQLKTVGSNAVLTVDITGNSGASVTQTITFTDGVNHGLGDSLQTLVSNKTFVLDYVV